ncbi:MAG: T9SS type A sorting domain-containing protein [Bacteroidales bacterium]|nr:T9SS type A sorting domain-containing protein [Bacteroidales bacterium]
MKKLLLNVSLILAFLFSANLIFAQYQLTNSGFENWESVSQKKPGLFGETISGNEPTQWNSFVTAQVASSTYASAIANKVEASSDVRPGTTGSKSAKIWTTSVLGVKANGNLTTGKIYGGSMTPSDASGNYNFSDPSSDAAFKHTFAGKPDSIATWLKFVPSSTSDKARVSAIIHENSRYQDPEPEAKTYTNVVAKAQKNFSATSNKGWQRISVPFVYEGDKTPAYILVSYTTNATPGGGNTNDALYIDDAEMIYNSKANSVSFNGTTFAGFNKNTYTYNNITGNVPSNVTAVVDGVSATYTSNIDKTNNRVTITVKGGDISANSSNYHTYTFNFEIPKVTVSVASANSTMGSAYIGSIGTTTAQIEKGSSTTITAVANSGYMFKNWTNNGTVVSTNATYSVTANDNMNLVANFVKVYTVSISVNKASYGTAYIGTAGVTSASVEEGASITITAVAADGYKFTSWKEGRDVISKEAVYTINNVSKDIEYVATFAAKTKSNLAFENSNVDYSDIDNNTFSNTASSTNSEGAISYAITETSEAGVATIDATTGVVTFLKVGNITVTATQEAWGDYLETSVSYTLRITPTGIEENNAENVAVYSNSGAIVIESNDVVKVQIFNMSGTLIKSTVSNGNNSIDVIKGVYIVKVSSDNNSKVVKVVVK